MVKKRIIPCLDIRDGKVVKGVKFQGLVELGNPASHARYYNDEGADELVILDVTASRESRRSVVQVIESVADSVFIPLVVGGGIRTNDDVRDMLRAGADRVSLNTAAIRDPSLISEAADRFGTQCILVAIDAKQRADGSGWNVFIVGGQDDTGKDVLEWAKEAEERGAGEILLTSMDRDGTQSGYDIALLKAVSSAVSIPLIASGGAGKVEHFAEAFSAGGADAVLAASLFHNRTLTIPDLKQYLSSKGVEIR
ncbi:MAG: imidazole glycerol phosphate synthase subunit HisF [Ignavibacteria bacterium]|nr:imidazole glycerol phosphate synthase subunit HisF [Ignavibacteria bacterium]